jgi:hypothetical protein
MWKHAFVGVAGVAGLATAAAAATKFGAKLTHEPPPAETCQANKPGNMCSWVMTIAYQHVGQEAAPKDGTIATVRLRACSAGSFVLQLAVVDAATDQARGGPHRPGYQ